MIRLRHETLPAGLSALVRRRADGDLDVIVSVALSAARQRAAVRAGLRAIEPARRHAGPLSMPALIAVALAGTWLRAIGRLIRLHLATSIAVAAAVTAAAVGIAVVPHVLGPANTGRSPATGALAPQPGSTASQAAPGSASPSASAVARPLPSEYRVAARSSPAVTTTPASVPPQSARPPAPSATPTASPTGGGSPICLELLGLWLCL